MKRVTILGEPQELTEFRRKHPLSTWKQMRDDGEGRIAYNIVRHRLSQEQGGLCSFCEVGIHSNGPLRCRVEHFHPKSDKSVAHNWTLDWENMLAVCMGGSQRHQARPYTMEPLEENLSCDAYKDKMIQSGSLHEQCEGWIINPKEIPAFPRLFFLERSTGRLLPDDEQCNVIEIENNQHPNTRSLVQNTIDMLNLNCDRLCEARLRVIWNIERNKKKLREQGNNHEQSLNELANRYFRQQWPVFFTTIRFCLGTTAEQYLNDTGFQG
ncbi:retron system putative HNH endonuclease [Saccharospirillum alexandrii]|uniref:retron system putative HNH endonuclease n=1 Tax=Saccharospirillum alexandrii TaxID=2448477 RepID=UPI003735EA6F